MQGREKRVLGEFDIFKLGFGFPIGGRAFAVGFFLVFCFLIDMVGDGLVFVILNMMSMVDWNVLTSKC